MLKTVSLLRLRYRYLAGVSTTRKTEKIFHFARPVLENKAARVCHRCVLIPIRSMIQCWLVNQFIVGCGSELRASWPLEDETLSVGLATGYRKLQQDSSSGCVPVGG